MAQHSKGPWRAAPEGVPYNAIVCDEPMRTYTDRYTAQMEREAYGGYLVCESVAPQNVPIITAAPDLLEALEGLYLAYFGGPSKGRGPYLAKELGLQHEFATNGYAAIAQALEAKANAAIAKAKGQSPA